MSKIEERVFSSNPHNQQNHIPSEVLDLDELHPMSVTGKIYSRNCGVQCRQDVLIVDDEAMNLLALDTMLGKRRIQSRKCDSGG